MKTRYLLLATLALPGTVAPAQTLPSADSSLAAFRSDRELSAYLGQLTARRATYLRRLAEERARQRAAAAACIGAVRLTGGAGATAPPAPADTAQRATLLRGRINDAAGAALGGAQVSVDELGGATSNSGDGRYRIHIPAERLTTARSVTVAARLIGYERLERTLTVSPGDSLEVDFTLCASGLQLSEVVTTGAAAAPSASESVTNTQHAGVDEGGIVKLHGDHLVMLRRGRLFTVALGDRDLRPVAAVNAFGPGIDPTHAWYDEILVSGDKVVVIGFSYERQGTEVGVFRIDRSGGLRHLATYHLRSDDYYSSRNYASRLIGSKLVFYAPLHLPLGEESPLAALPAMRKWRRRANEGRFERIVTPQRIHRPAREPDPSGDLALHTVTVCDLAAREPGCDATVVIGPVGRVFYVSPEAVYVWVTDGRDRAENRVAPAVLYRMPLNGSSPRALGVSGSPVDQFSFLESDDRHLNVLVRSEAAGDAMWRAEAAAGDVALMRVPLARFGDGSETVAPAGYRPLPSPAGGTFENRFVGHHLLYGTGSGWGGPRRGGSELYVVPWQGGQVARLTLPHGTDRIEALGEDAVVVGTDGRDLHFSGIRLDGRPDVSQRFRLRGASQGELRSHGFFYKPDGPSSGVLGLPVRGPGRPGYEHLFDGSASILFLRNDDRTFHELGELGADEDGVVDDGCKASCVDWYGNARPLFVGGRVFALLGYELVEGRIRAGRIREVRRISYAPGAVRAVAR